MLKFPFRVVYVVFEDVTPMDAEFPGKIKKLVEKLKRGKIFGFFYRFFKYRVTSVGKYILIFPVIAFILGGQILNTTYFLYFLVTFYGFLFLLSPIFRAIFLPSLKCKISSPQRVAANTTVCEEVTIENTSGRNAYQVFVRYENLPPQVTLEGEHGLYIPVIKNQEKIRAKVCLKMKRRGRYTLSTVRIESSFPLEVLKSGYKMEIRRDILVYPSFSHLLQCDIPAGRRLQPGGIALASSVGESTEFLSTREFQYGDDPRYIHWKSWARLGKPIVKEFQEEYFTRIAILIDTYIPPQAPIEKYEDFEASLSLVASVADFLQRKEYIVDIVSAGRQIFYIQAGRGLAYIDQILDILALLDVCHSHPYEEPSSFLDKEIHKISTLVAIFSDWDEERRRFLEYIAERGVNLKIFVVTSTPIKDIGSLYQFDPKAQLIDPQIIRKGITTI